MKIRGKREQITKCIFHICSILMEHPPKGNLIKKAFRSNIYICSRGVFKTRNNLNSNKMEKQSVFYLSDIFI